MNIAARIVKMDNEKPKDIWVIGDAMRDLYVYGTPDVCQDNCQMFREQQRISVPGGAANAVRSLAHWRSGENLRIFVQHCGESLKTRFVTGTCQIVYRHDNDHVCKKPELVHHAVWRAMEMEKLPDVVLMCDYNKGVLTEDFVQKMIFFCNIHCIPCVVDAKVEPSFYEGAIIKGNADWFKKYKPNMMTPNMVITNGKHSPTVAGRMVGPLSLPNTNVVCMNHVGAGDCFSAHLALALAHGIHLHDAAAFAHCAGRVYVQKPYNEPPKTEVIVEDVEKTCPLV